ncbi:methyltransferase [Spongiactinospora sp. 9N601]|uniref:methyltransferase n=1 Tax=Spongiactinospora sp. 9N601 TaxID=3375149 RepID=UPI003794AA6E
MPSMPGLPRSQGEAAEAALEPDVTESSHSNAQGHVEGTPGASGTHGRTPMPSDKHTPLPLIRIAMGLYESQVLRAGIELRLFEHLAAGPATAAELEKACGLHPTLSGDFLNALVAMDLLERDGSHYEMPARTAAHLDPRSPGYIGGALAFMQRQYPVWSDVTGNLRSGKALIDDLPGDIFMSGPYRTQQSTRGFAEGMDGLVTLFDGPLAQSFRWEQVTSFTDLGGCRGRLALKLAAAYPNLRAVVFDLPPLRPLFDELLQSAATDEPDEAGGAGLRSRVTFHAGDFFADPLPETQVYLLGHILHDWKPDKRRLLVERAFEHLPPGGSLLVYDSMIDGTPEVDRLNYLRSLHMRMIAGSSEYTIADGIRQLRDAGFTVEDPVALNEGTTLLVGNKPG